MNLEETIQSCYQIAEEHGFHDVKRTFGDTCALIHSEISEAYEFFRKDGKYRFYIEIDGKPEGVIVELADAVIRIFDTVVNDLGVSPNHFVAVLEQKMEYNRRRPYMHNKVI